MKRNKPAIRRIAAAVLMTLMLVVLLQTAVMAASQTYIVQKGDTVYIISQKMGVSPSEIIADNGLVYPYEIYPGQELVINVPDAGQNQWSDQTPDQSTPLPSVPSEMEGLKTGNSLMDNILDWTKSYGWVVLFAILKAFNLL